MRDRGEGGRERGGGEEDIERERGSVRGGGGREAEGERQREGGRDRERGAREKVEREQRDSWR